MFTSFLAKIGVPILGTLLGEALNTIDHPATKTAAKALHEVDAAIKRGQISETQMQEAHRHAEAIAALKMRENGLTLSEVNQSLRAEIASQDTYVRRMRPTFGYIMAGTWAAQMFGIAYVMIFDTAHAGALIHAMSALSAIWGVGLSVLGVYVYKRSEEKKNQL